MQVKISGVNVIWIVNKEIALYYAYELDKKNKNILVFHMRSNETNVTILNLKDSIFENKGTVGVGRNVFNEELFKYCINQFKEQTGIIINNNPKACGTLELICEINERKLSDVKEISIDIDALSDGEDFKITITRPQFEFICEN